MTTSTSPRSDFEYLVRSGYAFDNVTAFFMHNAGTNMARVARLAGVSRQYVRQCVVGDKPPSDAVRDAFSKILGFDPWRAANV